MNFEGGYVSILRNDFKGIAGRGRHEITEAGLAACR